METEPDGVLERAVELLQNWARQPWDVSVEAFLGPYATDEQIARSLSEAQPAGVAGSTGQLQLPSGWDAYWASNEAGVTEAGLYPGSGTPEPLRDALTSWLDRPSTELPNDPWQRRLFGDVMVEVRMYGQKLGTPLLMVSLEPAAALQATSPPDLERLG